jgi:hypothetical protein
MRSEWRKKQSDLLLNFSEERGVGKDVPFILPPFMHVLASKTMAFQVVRDAL